MVSTTKFPEWLEANGSKLSEEEKKRYEGQQVCAAKIIAIFDKPGYSDDDTETATQIMALMNEVCNSDNRLVIRLTSLTLH